MAGAGVDAVEVPDRLGRRGLEVGEEPAAVLHEKCGVAQAAPRDGPMPRMSTTRMSPGSTPPIADGPLRTGKGSVQSRMSLALSLLRIWPSVQSWPRPGTRRRAWRRRGRDVRVPAVVDRHRLLRHGHAQVAVDLEDDLGHRRTARGRWCSSTGGPGSATRAWAVGGAAVGGAGVGAEDRGGGPGLDGGSPRVTMPASSPCASVGRSARGAAITSPIKPISRRQGMVKTLLRGCRGMRLGVQRVAMTSTPRPSARAR